MNAHRPSTAQSISRGSRKPSSSVDSGTPHAYSEGSVLSLGANASTVLSQIPVPIGNILDQALQGQMRPKDLRRLTDASRHLERRAS